MKTIFTFSIIRTFILTFIVVFSALSLVAQTTHSVSVTDYQFTPKDLTINAGDIVVWTNTGAMGHNVNGTQTTFPNNPESFGNNVGLNWTYQYVFKTAGHYDYHCDPHAAFGMVGTITVNPATSADVLAKGGFQLYPNPASDYIDLLFSGNNGGILKIYSITGTLVDQKVLPNKAQSYRYDLNGLKKGYYFIKISADTRTSVLKFLKD
ncbi:MAG: plastocyanin/azurin family copper-binding protein [Methylococcaceae bacterium]|nr:plastocyanin/azurin family copper-binding protein [Prolixibacteraceae bacterium]